MSFILDALKKSEAERQRQAGPALLEMRIERPTRRLPAWAIVLGTVLCGCIVALAWVALRRTASPAAAPPPAAVVAAPAAGGAQSAAGVPAAGAPTGAPVASVPATNAPGVNMPAANMPSGSAVVASAPLISANTASAQSSSESDDNPADVAPAEAPSAGVARERAETRGLRNYVELGGTLPELRLDLHVYASKPAERYAFINMHKLREGEATPEGVTVVEITPDGVVLEYHGTEFLLGR